MSGLYSVTLISYGLILVLKVFILKSSAWSRICFSSWKSPHGPSSPYDKIATLSDHNVYTSTAAGDMNFGETSCSNTFHLSRLQFAVKIFVQFHLGPIECGFNFAGLPLHFGVILTSFLPFHHVVMFGNSCFLLGSFFVAWILYCFVRIL